MRADVETPRRKDEKRPMSYKRLAVWAGVAVIAIAVVAIIHRTNSENSPQKPVPAASPSKPEPRPRSSHPCCRSDGKVIVDGKIAKITKVNGKEFHGELEATCDPKGPEFRPCQIDPLSSLCCSSGGTIMRARTNGTYRDEGVPCNPNGSVPGPCQTRP